MYDRFIPRQSKLGVGKLKTFVRFGRSQIGRDLNVE